MYPHSSLTSVSIFKLYVCISSDLACNSKSILLCVFFFFFFLAFLPSGLYFVWLKSPLGRGRGLKDSVILIFQEAVGNYIIDYELI